MNPLRGAAHRTRTFLSEPVRAAAEQTQQHEIEQIALLHELLDAVTTGKDALDGATRENRRLFVALRSLLDEQNAQIGELRAEVNRLSAAAS